MNEHEYIEKIISDIKEGKPIVKPSDHNLDNLDLSGGVFLSSIVESLHASITNCDLKNIIVETLSGAVSNCNLSESWIKKSIEGLFETCDFSNCQSSSVKVNLSDFFGCKFDGTNFKGSILDARFENCKFEAVDFTNSKFADAIIESCHFSDTSFSNCNFIDGVIEKCSFNNCDFIGSKISADDINSTKFTNVNFTSCDFSKRTFNDTQFIDCSFEMANLLNCNIFNCSFDGCNFERCILPDGKIGSHKTELGSNGQYHSKSLMSEREIRLLEEGEALEKEASNKAPEQLSLFPRKKDEARQVPLEEVNQWLRDFDDGKLEIKEPKIRKAIENNRLSSMEQEFRIRKLKEFLASLDTK